VTPHDRSEGILLCNAGHRWSSPTRAVLARPGRERPHPRGCCGWRTRRNQGSTTPGAALPRRIGAPHGELAFAEQLLLTPRRRARRSGASSWALVEWGGPIRALVLAHQLAYRFQTWQIFVAELAAAWCWPTSIPRGGRPMGRGRGRPSEGAARATWRSDGKARPVGCSPTVRLGGAARRPSRPAPVRPEYARGR